MRVAAEKNEGANGWTPPPDYHLERMGRYYCKRDNVGVIGPPHIVSPPVTCWLCGDALPLVLVASVWCPPVTIYPVGQHGH